MHPNASYQRFLFLYEAVLNTPAKKFAVDWMMKTVSKNERPVA
jgi:hypothetical protein